MFMQYQAKWNLGGETTNNKWPGQSNTITGSYWIQPISLKIIQIRSSIYSQSTKRTSIDKGDIMIPTRYQRAVNDYIH